jgi:hypothetical protein
MGCLIKCITSKFKRVKPKKLSFEDWECSKEGISIRQQYHPAPYTHHAMTQHLHDAYTTYSGISPCESCSCKFMEARVQ